MSNLKEHSWIYYFFDFIKPRKYFSSEIKPIKQIVFVNPRRKIALFFKIGLNFLYFKNVFVWNLEKLLEER